MNSPLENRELRLCGLWPLVPGAGTCGGAIRLGPVADAAAPGTPHTGRAAESAQAEFARL
jgi:hypothetical protein